MRSPPTEVLPVHPAGQVPTYHGTGWIEGTLPSECEPWPKFSTRRVVEATGDDYDLSRAEVRAYAKGKPWVWPNRTIYFFCDLHADTDAFFCSLVASGGVAKTGERDEDFELTETGKTAKFLIGGDCFDKGPNNLRLLRALQLLIEKGADVGILAGNHDVRAVVGLVYAGRKEPRFSHLFVRMGRKAVPLFREIWDRYLVGEVDPKSLASDDEVRRELWPPETWYDEFPAEAAEFVSPGKIQKELRRIREKSTELVERCATDGLTLGMMKAAADKARELFLAPDGEFAWFFRNMRLAERAGSFLFIHAGVDDLVARVLRRDGLDGLNAEFDRLMKEDLFELYHGPVGNTFRTKYRDFELPLTERGVRDIYRTGIYAVVHGHRNIHRGQRVVLRNGMLNFECDASVDRNTRSLEGLEGAGGAVVVLQPSGRLVGISTDYPYAKVFDAARVLDTTAIV